MYFEIYKKGVLVKRGQDNLNDISWSNELMDTPQTSLSLPLSYKDFLSGREEIKIFISDKCFWGIVSGLTLTDETIEVDIDHIIKEWEFRQISVNNAIKEKNINIIYKEEDESSAPTVEEQLEKIYNDTNFAMPGWKLNFSDKAKETKIDYVYSRQTKLDALTKTMELTPDLFWRVRFINNKEVDISEFGSDSGYMITENPSGSKNIQLIEEPKIEYDFDSVVNLMTVYSEKSDTGMSSLTLREVYNDKSLQLDSFPVVILRNNVNNERDYSKYVTQYPSLAPNNELEYAILDEESIALEGGTVIEDTVAFNDIAPFETKDEEGNTKEITDADRIEAAKTAYNAAVKKLKLARRRYKIKITVGEMPGSINVGDKIRFIYNSSLYILGACSNYQKKILTLNDYFYITARDTTFSGEMETNELTLEKHLFIDRES